MLSRSPLFGGSCGVPVGRGMGSITFVDVPGCRTVVLVMTIGGPSEGVTVTTTVVLFAEGTLLLLDKTIPLADDGDRVRAEVMDKLSWVLVPRCNDDDAAGFPVLWLPVLVGAALVVFEAVGNGATGDLTLLDELKGCVTAEDGLLVAVSMAVPESECFDVGLSGGRYDEEVSLSNNRWCPVKWDEQITTVYQ
jgi:hypothetical protein